VPKERWPGLRLTLHPTVALLRSRFPVVSIWQANVTDSGGTIREWRQESALIARPALEVEVHRLSAGTYAFLSALAEGETVGAAIERAASDQPQFDVTECLAKLISSNIIIHLDLSGDTHATHI
jgi:hypothetical protein